MRESPRASARSPRSPRSQGSALPAARAALAWLLLLAPFAGFLWESRAVHPQIDDAYISYRYAENLVLGHGLVFNPGERVEGMTNLLWTLMVAVGLRLGLPAEAVGHGLGVLSGVGVLAATAALARGGLRPMSVALTALAVWVVYSSPAFGAWATSGMETPLFVALVSWALVAEASGRSLATTVALVLASVTRPEGVLVAAIVYAFHALRHWRSGLGTWWAPLAYGAAMALVTAFRLAYYGSPVPNTFYAKVGGIPLLQGWIYTRSFIVKGAGFLLLPAAIAVLRDRTTWPCAAFIVALIVYVILIGGDLFGRARFLLPALPCLAALCVRGVTEARAISPVVGALVFSLVPAAIGWQLWGSGFASALIVVVPASVTCCLWDRLPGLVERSGAVAALALAALVLAAGPLGAGGAAAFSPEERFDKLATLRGYYDFYARRSKQRATRIAARGEGRPLVAIAAIGSFGYFSHLPILDILGLVDPMVSRSGEVLEGSVLLPGHQRSNTSYIFERRPAYILISQPGDVALAIPAVEAIWRHPELARSYVWDVEIEGYRRKIP